MALTGTALTDEVQALCGRPTNQVLLTNDRVTRWLNEAQRKIAEECPGLDELQFDNETSLDTTEVIIYALNEITIGDATDIRPCYIFDVFYLDGQESRKLEWIHPDEFEAAYPDPTHSDIAKHKPTHWTMQADLSGGYIKMMPFCLTTYCDKDLRIVGSAYPEDFTVEDTTRGLFIDCDDAMIAYGVCKGWGAIRDENKASVLLQKFVGTLEDIKTQSTRDHAWDGNIFYSEYD